MKKNNDNEFQLKPALSGQEKKRKILQENLGEEIERGNTGEVLEPAVNT